MANSYNLTLTVSPRPEVTFKGIYKDKDFKEILTTSDTYTETVFDGSVVDAFIRYRNNPVAVKLLKLTDGGTTVAYDVQLNSTTKNMIISDTSVSLDDYVTDFDPDLTIKINKLQPSTSNGKTVTLNYGGKEYDASDGKNTIKVPAASSITLTPSFKNSFDNIKPGMVWVYNKLTSKYMFVTGPWLVEKLREDDELAKEYPNPEENLVPLGIVVIPAGHAELQYPMVMALKPIAADVDDYEKGPTDKYMKMFGVPADSMTEAGYYSDQSVKDYVVTVDKTTREINGMYDANSSRIAYIPSVSDYPQTGDDNSNFDPCVVDVLDNSGNNLTTKALGTAYYCNAIDLYCPSPYDRDGNMNPKYFHRFADNSTSQENALAIFADATLGLRSNNNGEVNNIADACLAYSAGGYTRKGDWVIPSVSMLGYFAARNRIILEVLYECGDVWGVEHVILPPSHTATPSGNRAEVTNDNNYGFEWLSSSPRHYLVDSPSDDLRFWTLGPGGALGYTSNKARCIVYPFYPLKAEEVENAVVINYEIVPYDFYQYL